MLLHRPLSDLEGSSNAFCTSFSDLDLCDGPDHNGQMDPVTPKVFDAHPFKQPSLIHMDSLAKVSLRQSKFRLKLL